MRKTVHKIAYMLTAFFFAAILFVSAYCSGAVVRVSAEDLTVSEAYEKQNVLDDLKGSTIGGQPFDLEDWQYNERGKMQIISFVEFCYSFYEAKQDDFGLYIYVYNPQGLAVNTSSELNKIQFTYGSNAGYAKYPLEFLNYSTEAGYEGLFYKFKISLTPSQKKSILSGVEQNARVYTVTGFEVSVGGSVTEYAVGSTYTYSGFSEGYGSELATSDTLSCVVDEFDRYIELNVTHTVYRPKGDFYDGEQSQLNSCFFRVPDEYFEDYGELYKIACEWYEYVTKPALITEDWYIYQKMSALYGAPVNELIGNMAFLFTVQGNTDSSWFGKHGEGLGWTSNISMQETYQWLDGLIHAKAVLPSDIRFDSFSSVFYTGGEDYSTYGVSAEEMEKQFLINSEKLGGAKICDNYSEALFEDYVDENHVRGYNGGVEISADDSRDIFWTETIKSSFWQKVFGGYDINTIYDSVKAIVTVSENDLQGTDEEIAARLYIAVSDVNKLKTEYRKAKVLGEQVVLFRYGNSVYFSAPCAQAYSSKTANDPDWAMVKKAYAQCKDAEYSAYVAQTTVYLNFDIISLTFRDDNFETVIPVVSSPSNAFSGFDPPNEEDYHTGKSAAEKLLTAIIILLLVVVVFIVLSPILMPILKPVFSVIGNAVVWVVTAPFKLIGKLFKKKPKETGQIPPQVVVVNPTEYKGVKSPPAPKKKTKTAGNNTSTKANKDGK